MGLHAQVLEIV